MSAGTNEPEFMRHLLREIQSTRQECAEGHAESMKVLNQLGIP